MEPITDSKVTAELADSAKKLAPWQSGLSWWVILIEGVALAIVGLLIVLDPEKANIRIGLVLSLILFIAGLLQSWALFRNRAPEPVDGIVGARATLGIFSGLIILWLFVSDLLTAEVGLLILGLGSLFYGLLGLFVVFNTVGSQRMAAFLELIFFTGFGAVVLYTRYAGATVVSTGITIIGWLGIIMGAVLIVYSFIRRGQENTEEQAAASAAAAVDRVSARTTPVAPTTSGDLAKPADPPTPPQP